MRILDEFQLNYQETDSTAMVGSKVEKECCFREAYQQVDEGLKRSLGITGKSSGPYEQKNGQKTLINQRSIEVFERDELPQDDNDSQIEKDDNQETNLDIKNESRIARFTLQKSTKEVLLGTKNPKGKKWQTMDCLWSVVSGSDVAVLYSPSVLKAHYGGLATCGSVWVCPVCSAKISERRKVEIVTVSDIHKQAGGGLYMVTLTWAHSRHDDLQAMVKSSREALRRLRMHRSYVQNSKEIDYVGMIRAFEVTHGDANGWHPHFHELWFLKQKLTARQLESWNRVLFEQWRKQCLRAGLGEPNRTVGIKIIEAESASEYVAKFGNAPRWSVGSELTKHQTKHGKNGNRSPWDLLRLYAEGESRFAHLFREYANAFFGARQVYWSNGFKKLFGIQEMTDEALAKMSEQDAYEVCRISKELWKKVLSQPYEARPLILQLAETGGAKEVGIFLGSL